MDIGRIIKRYYEQLHAHKSGNSDEMDQFLERHKLPKPTQGKIDSWVDISIIDDFTGGLYQTFKEEMILLSTTSSRKHRQREHFLTHSMRPALP